MKGLGLTGVERIYKHFGFEHDKIGYKMNFDERLVDLLGERFVQNFIVHLKWIVVYSVRGQD